MYIARITITIRPSILDPQGKATYHALQNLGFEQVNSVRIGKYMELHISADTQAAAESVAHATCEKLLANPIMEDYSVQIEPSAE